MFSLVPIRKSSLDSKSQRQPAATGTASSAAAAFLIGVFSPPANATETAVRYRGVCNASAAVALDADYFLAADDEEKELFLYRFGAPDAVGKVDLKTYLTTGPKLKEVDLEGAARIGDRVYIISSHGNNKDGEFRESRHRLFYVEVKTGPGFPAVTAPAARPFTGLLAALEKDARFAALNLAGAKSLSPKTKGGVSIEGLAEAPGGGLYVGFRNPYTADHHAFVAELKNPAALLDSAAAPVFGELIKLDLGKRGVRSIERIGNRYLIAAGPYVDAKDAEGAKDIAMFTWSGETNSAPVQLTEVKTGALNAEAVFASTDGKTLHILSDDGKGQPGCKECEDTPAADRGFNALAVPMPGQ